MTSYDRLPWESISGKGSIKDAALKVSKSKAKAGEAHNVPRPLFITCCNELQ